MERIIIFGSSGMLGHYIKSFLTEMENYIIFPLSRKDYDIETNDYEKLVTIINSYDPTIIINCSGAIPQRVFEYKKFITVNTLFPLNLEKICQKNIKLIHITTDCVFNGKDGNYFEDSLKNDTSIYGVTKMLGEPKNACIIRTSIIGESETEKGLLEWVKSQNNSTIDGYTNHYWNGVTCLQLAKIIDEIISKKIYWKGVKHIFSPNIISKYELIKNIIKVFNLNIQVNEKEAEYCNRSLNSNDNMFLVPDIISQLYELKNYLRISNIPYGNYKTNIYCRFCDKEVINVISLGSRFPLAGGFLRNLEDKNNEKIYPLSLNFCNDCKLLQCKQVVDSDVLFKQGYFYYSSTIPMLVNHFNNYAKHLKKKFPEKNKIVEIGCNDGVFLRPLKENGFTTIGVDPSSTVYKLIEDGFEIYNDYFNEEIVNKILNKHGQIDLFLSSNSFAHIDKMKDIIILINKILKDDGIAIIEVHNSKTILNDLNFDFIYHEHMSYYTVTSFYYISKLYNMTLYDIEYTNIHGGSIRVYLKKGINIENPKILNILENEKYLCNINTYFNYHDKLESWRIKFTELYYNLRKTSNKIYGYGSSGRANIFCRYTGIDLDKIIDDSEYKIGSYTPVYHQKIESSKILEDFPEYVIILAWPYAQNIINNNLNYIKNGGKFVIPLPEIKIINDYGTPFQ